MDVPLTFIWPSMLISLFLVPLLVLLYLWLQQRRQRMAASFGRLDMGTLTKGRKSGFRSHLPAALFLSGLTILIISLARPQAVISLPRVEGTVILLFDVSGSMAAEDVEPTRLEAAKDVAREFIQNQPLTVQIGVVSFSNSGFTVQSPTHEHEAILAAVDRLQPQSSTALGQGILASLNAIAVNAGEQALGVSSQPNLAQAEDGSQIEIPEGHFPNSTIVLLSDGENNEASDPLLAAIQALERSVRIYTVGVGTREGTGLEVEGFIVHTRLEEAALRQISEITGGAYYHAANETDLRTVYNDLTPQLVVKPEAIEVTSILAGASILVLLCGAAFSLLWFSRLP
jgi:Ca-activated chloride channel homolog